MDKDETNKLAWSYRRMDKRYSGLAEQVGCGRMESDVQGPEEDERIRLTSDVIHRPDHYTWRDCGESLGLIKHFVKNQEDSFLAFCEGNVLKYLYRYPKKNGVEDLKKAREYLNRMIEHLEDEK